ncbi:uncharacterized mitochondrial protein AtMg00860-like [Arachis stenosperma]|uniref:uncharacterized mitochondrial protein AtMg00860-like n=1 Tax=Arachis stenosperma TaxID=217475 RepID=UPI0025AD14D9|nr:uncharacterized mitochondrial protein AtMg00860-like [Arachis stenosperma]
MDWKQPTTVTEIRSFLGLAGYYRRFIKGFSQLALPLTKLTRKDTPFVWTPECEENFQALKKKLTTAPVLVLPEPNKPFEVAEEMLMHKLYEVMSAHGLTKKSDDNSNTVDNVGALTENNNNKAVAHPSSIETRGQQREITPFRYTYRRR